MAVNVQQWADGLNGRFVDRDGGFGAQCHDLFLDYLYKLGGKPGDGHAPGTGFTDQVWRQFPHYRPNLATIFTKHDASDIRAGDVVFWSAYAGVGGLPHVAIALEPARNGRVFCLTQNPGAATKQHLTLNGVLGVLRPIGSGGVTGKTQQKAAGRGKKERMVSGFYYVDAGLTWCIIVDTQSGYCDRWQSNDGAYNSAIAEGYALGRPFVKVTKKHADAIVRSAADTRARLDAIR